MNIRKFTNSDLAQMVQIWNEIVLKGETFPQENCLNLVEANTFFSSQSYTGVIEEDNEILGLYILHPNNVGRCGHIANASYAVKENQRGKHLGKQLVENSLMVAKDLSFKILQFNAVVENNKGAIHLYEKIGFHRLGTMPKGFKNKDNVYLAIHNYYIEL